jgi:hypothetical protein
MALAFPERSARALSGTVAAAVLRPLHARPAIRLIDPARWSRAHKFPPIVRAASIGLRLFANRRQCPNFYHKELL